MANKYKQYSLKRSVYTQLARHDHKRDRQCSGKIPFDSREAALTEQPAQRAYLCRYCQRWHLTTSTRKK